MFLHFGPASNYMNRCGIGDQDMNTKSRNHLRIKVLPGLSLSRMLLHQFLSRSYQVATDDFGPAINFMNGRGIGDPGYEH